MISSPAGRRNLDVKSRRAPRRLVSTRCGIRNAATIPPTPNIQPSMLAIVRSDEVRVGFKNPASVLRHGRRGKALWRRCRRRADRRCGPRALSLRTKNAADIGNPLEHFAPLPSGVAGRHTPLTGHPVAPPERPSPTSPRPPDNPWHPPVHARPVPPAWHAPGAPARAKGRRWWSPPRPMRAARPSPTPVRAAPPPAPCRDRRDIADMSSPHLGSRGRSGRRPSQVTFRDRTAGRPADPAPDPAPPHRLLPGCRGLLPSGRSVPCGPRRRRRRA